MAKKTVTVMSSDDKWREEQRFKEESRLFVESQTRAGARTRASLQGFAILVACSLLILSVTSAAVKFGVQETLTGGAVGLVALIIVLVFVSSS